MARLYKEQILWLARVMRPVPRADWFHVFMAVGGADGGAAPVPPAHSTRERLMTAEQLFTPAESGELCLFVNDLKSAHKNNRGLMTLEVSRADTTGGGSPVDPPTV